MLSNKERKDMLKWLFECFIGHKRYFQEQVHIILTSSAFRKRTRQPSTYSFGEKDSTLKGMFIN